MTLTARRSTGGQDGSDAGDPGEWKAELGAATAEMLAGRALGSLRGPMSRGAVPVQVLAQHAGVSRGVVARQVAREVGGPGALPFDLAVHGLFDPARNDERDLRLRFLGALPPTLRLVGVDGASLKELRQQFEGFLTTTFASRRARQVAALEQLLHLAAVLCNPAMVDEGTALSASAIVASRRAAYDESVTVEGAALRVVLRAAGRRIRAGVTAEQVVIAVQALFDGYLQRFLLDQERYPLSDFVTVAWELTWAMSEPGIFAPPNKEQGRTRVIRDAAERAQELGAMPGAEEILVESGPGPHHLTGLSDDPNQLAWACLDLVLGSVPEIRRIVDGVPGSSTVAVSALLESVAVTVDRYSVVANSAPDSPAWGELRTLVADLLSTDPKLDNGFDFQHAAELAVEQARRGIQGRDGWQAVLKLMASRSSAGTAKPTPGRAR